MVVTGYDSAYAYTYVCMCHVCELLRNPYIWTRTILWNAKNVQIEGVHVSEALH